ncbi:MAG TPA: putative glycoside hydrolase [Gemmatimonadaceae bacterium]|nr:putative glycoside hydrolase [Gemmatimonadaceae bacterium]
MIKNRVSFVLLAALVAACAAQGTESSAGRPSAADTDAAARAPVRDSVRSAPAPVSEPVDSAAAVADADSVLPPPAGRPPRLRRMPTPSPVRGLYVNRWTAAGPAIWKLLATVRHSEINALVIDVKDDRGLLLYPSTVGLAHAVGADTAGVMPVRRFHALMDSLRVHHLYAIARIVVARDPLLAAARPAWAVTRRTDAAPWRDSRGTAWLDPDHREAWAYAADLASEAVARGFSEVMFDDVRFPDEAGMAAGAAFAIAAGRSRTQVIRDQLTYLRSRADVLGVPVAITIAGPASSDTTDLGIGQRWELLADRADVVMPLDFPSSFPAGYHGLAAPAEHPYETITHALADARQRSARVRGAGDLVPWYQAFTLGAPAYDSARVREQIRAGYDQGVRSWMLWNPASEYLEAYLHEPVRHDSTAARKPSTAKKPGIVRKPVAGKKPAVHKPPRRR